MKLITEIKQLREIVKNIRYEQDKKIGFVPTMGALHGGHLTLVEEAQKHSDYVFVSIFVNPKQFGPNEDYAAYPRDLSKDLQLLSQQKVDFVFAPELAEMWPEGNETFVDTQYLSNILQGKERPGHFCGVLTVVAKLFNLIGPDKAFFGEKDFQQLVIIKRMVKDLAFNVEIIGVPIIREKDGLAASSRNVFLTAKQREQASILYKALQQAEKAFFLGERNSAKLRQIIAELIASADEAEIESIAILQAENLKAVDVIKGDAVILLSVKFGAVRLLDQKTLCAPL